MKHSKLAALSVLALAAGAACAQSSVTLYGVIDTGVERITNVGAASSSVTRMPGQSGGFLPSRWGVRGSEDLGNGLKANFVLESGFSPDKGTNSTNQGGRLFGRSAWVGLSSAQLGALSFGRQYTMYYWSLLDADPMGPAIYGLGSLDAGIPGARSDNSIAYKGTWAGFTAGATYSLGRDAVGAGATPTTCVGETAGDYKACKEYSVLAKYDASIWGVALAFDEQRGGAGAPAAFASSAQTDRRRIANGYVKFGPVKASLGLVKRNNAGATVATIANLTPRTDLWFVEADWAVTPAVTITPLWARLKYKDSADGSKSTMYSLRVGYALSKRTALYATAGRMSNKGSASAAISGGTVPADAQATAPVAGGSQNGYMIGVRHSF